MPKMPWIKLWTEEWLDGSVRETLSMQERAIWIDLLTLAGRSRQRGLIQSGENVPYSHKYLAERFQVPIELLEVTLQKCIKQKRISEDGNGIRILNWKKYQSEFKKRKPYRQKKDNKDDPNKYVEGKYGHVVKR